MPTASPFACRTLLASVFLSASFLFSGSALADKTPSLGVISVAGQQVISVGEGREATSIHQTNNAVTETRLVHAPGSNAVVITWNETINGIPVPHYSMSLDGVTFSEPRPTEYRIKLRYADFDPLAQTPPVAGPVSSQPVERADASLYIVQFIAPPKDELVSAVRALGGQPKTFLAHNANVVEMTPAVAEQVAALPTVRWVSEFHPAYRVEEPVLQEILGNGRMPTRRYSIMMFDRGAAPQQVVANAIQALGGIVNTQIPEGFRIEATLTKAQLLEVLHMNQVKFVDTWGPPGTDLDIARQIGGAVPLLSNLGFTGQGVRGEVMDDGLRQTHLGFQTPSALIHGSAPSVTSHGTNTYGIVFGNGAANTAGVGFLPNREQGIFARYGQLAGNGGTVSRYTHTAELVNPSLPFRAVFQSNSWGGTLTTAYTTVSAEMDDILLLNNIVICQSQSNTGNQNSRPQAWAKNIVSVGGIQHQNTLTKVDDAQSGASIGPAADGRVKPDLAHFYDNVLTTTSSSDTAYTTSFGGTSAATPITCGHFGLLFQMWHEGVFPGFGGAGSVFDSRPAHATAKAMMINTASRYTWGAGGNNNNLTRFRQGWGMADLARLYNDRNKMFIVNQTDVLLPLQVKTYQVTVPPGEPELRVTMVYTDPQGVPNSTVHRINDLSLKVTAPNGTFYWGNNGLTSSNWSTAGGNPNTIDTVENVFIQNPAPGTWTISVHGDIIVQDSRLSTPQIDADFALVVVGVTPQVLCPGDINGDGTVNVNDLLMVINAWGACPVPPQTCPPDIAPPGGDGMVNVNDLLMVINTWGGCSP